LGTICAFDAKKIAFCEVDFVLNYFGKRNKNFSKISDFSFGLSAFLIEIFLIVSF